MKSTLTLAVATLALGGLARAADPVHEFECDTPAGHFSYWSQTLSARKVTISGVLNINEMRDHERWNPTASLLLLSDEPKTSLGLQIFTPNNQRGVMFLRLAEPKTDPDAGFEQPFAMISGDTKTIPFMLSLSRDGTLEVTAAGKAASTTLKDFTPGKLQLSCSTGDFEFKDVSVKQWR